MARAFRFDLRGQKQLDRALKQIPKSTGKSTLRTALRRAAKPVAVDAKSRAPVGPTGNLRDSIEVKTTLKKSQKSGREKAGDVEVFIGATWPKGAHAHLIEFGTANMAAQPFMRPAWDANKDLVLATISDEIWESLSRAAKRLARQAETGRLGKGARRHFGVGR